MPLRLRAGWLRTVTLDLHQRSRARAPARTSARAGRVRVLVADDHSGFRWALEALVRSSDELMLVGSACNGEEAVHLAAELRPQVIVMDLAMPGLGGIEATRRIRGQQWPPAVVALSGSRELMREAVAAGAVFTVLKDEEPQRLLELIREASGV
jgi:DNA-binding NarL/FixJ family response regulator